MIQLGENRRFTATFLAIVAVFVWATALLFARLLSISDFATALGYLGIVTVAAWLAWVLLNRYLWRKGAFRAFLKIPDLSGRWEGWYFSTMRKEWRPTAHEISQEALEIVAHAWGPDNWARGICASLVTDRFGGAPELIWAHKTDPTTQNVRSGDTHTGTHFLRLSEREGNKYLEGRYITDRVRDDGSLGSVGFIRLVWVSPEHKNALDFQEQRWGMSKPEGQPNEAKAAT
jgi:hypothetical protein